jgi:hypothetical protein
MSAAQELFQLFIIYFDTHISTRRIQLALRAAVSVAASFNGKTRVADRSGMRKRFAEVFPNRQ